MATSPFKVVIEIGGKVAASLGGAISQAQRQVSGLGANVVRSMNASAATSKRAFKDVFNSAAWQQAAVGATAVAAGLGLAVKAAVEFDQSMADVRKAIDFKDGIEGARKFGEEIIKLSTEIPYSAKELSAIAAAAGFAGYKQPEILPFVRAAAQMGVAFAISADQAGDMMVGLRAGMALSQSEVVKLTDSINYLSDNFQGTVTAADLGEVTRRIGAVGVASGLAADEVAGLGAAFLASGTPVEVAATGLKNFLKAMTAGEAMTPKAQAALATILGGRTAESIKAQMAMLQGVTGKGVKKLRTKLKDDLKGIGSSLAEDIAQQMQIDPEGAIRKVIEGLAKRPAWERPGLVSLFFKEESKAAIMPLLTNVKLLEQAFSLIKNPEVKGSMMREFNNQMSTTSAQFKVFKNQLSAIGISVGAVLLPALNAIMKALSPVLRGLVTWTQQHKKLTLAIVLVTGALAGLVIALPVLAAIIASAGIVAAAFAGAIPIIAGLGTVIAVLATGPIAAVGAAIIGAGLIFKALYDKVPIFKTIVDATCTAVSDHIKWVLSNIKSTFVTDTGEMRITWNNLVGGIKAAVTGLLDHMRGTLSGLQSLFSGTTTAIQSAWQVAINALKAAGSGFLDQMRWILSSLQSLFSGTTTAIQSAWQVAINALKAAGSDWWTHMSAVLEGIKTAFLGWLDWLGSVFVAAMGDLGIKSGSAFASGLLKAAQEGIAAMGALTGGAMGAAAGVAGQALGGGGGGGGAGAGSQTLQGNPKLPGYRADHSTGNEHVHHMAASAGEAKAVAGALQRAGFPITEFGGWNQRVGKHSATGGHYDKRAMDIPVAIPRHGEVLRIINKATSDYRGGTPKRQFGGSVMRGLDYLVGEKGPERFTAPATGEITPQVEPRVSATPGRHPGNRPGVHLNVGGITVNAPANEAPVIARAIQDALRDMRFGLESNHRLLLND